MAGTRKRNPFIQDRDDRAHDLIEHYLDTYGLGYDLAIPMAGHDAANEGRRSVNAGAKHFGVSAACWVTDGDGRNCTGCDYPSQPHALHVRLFDKQTGRAYVADQADGDPGRLRFNPYARGVARDNRRR